MGTGLGVGMKREVRIVQCWWCGGEIEWKESDGNTFGGASENWKNLFCNESCNLAYCREKVREMAYDELETSVERSAVGDPTEGPAGAVPENQNFSRDSDADAVFRRVADGLNEVRQKAMEMCLQGFAKYLVCRETGLSGPEVTAIQDGMVPLKSCRCGKPWRHRGMCAVDKRVGSVKQTVPAPPKAVVAPPRPNTGGQKCRECDKLAVRRLHDGSFVCKDHVPENVPRNGLTMGIHREAAAKMVDRLAVCPECKQMICACGENDMRGTEDPNNWVERVTTPIRKDEPLPVRAKRTVIKPGPYRDAITAAMTELAELEREMKRLFNRKIQLNNLVRALEGMS